MSDKPLLTDEQNRVKALYLVWAEACNGIRIPEPLTTHRMYQLGLFLLRGWTADDLRVTLRYLRKKFWRSDRPEMLRGMYHWTKLFGDPEFEFFESYRGDALADQRNTRPAPSTKDAALRAVNRPTAQDDAGQAARPVGEVLQRIQGWDKLKRDAGLL